MTKPTRQDMLQFLDEINNDPDLTNHKRIMLAAIRGELEKTEQEKTTFKQDMQTIRDTLIAGKDELEWQLEEASSDRMTRLLEQVANALNAIDRLADLKP